MIKFLKKLLCNTPGKGGLHKVVARKSVGVYLISLYHVGGDKYEVVTLNKVTNLVSLCRCAGEEVSHKRFDKLCSRAIKKHF